jgi:tetratricopeptide (TPR) repeat protein
VRPAIHPTPLGAFCRRALAAALLACLALCGCQEADSLEAIRQQQAAGDYAGSIEPLLELLKTQPDDAETNYLYGRALAMTLQPSLATWSLRKAMQDPEWLLPAGRQLAFAALATSDFNEVVEVTGRILEREPEDVPALLMRAQAHAYWRKEPEKALEDANRALELDPDALEAFEPRILALLALGRQEEASQALAEAGRRMASFDVPESLVAWHCATTAIFADDAGEIERARETWSQCLDQHPSHTNVVWSALKFYDAQQEWDRSLEVLRAALAGEPASRAFRVGLADRLRLAGEAAEAEALLREGTRDANPELAAQAWMDLGRLRLAMREYAAAAEAMGRAVELARELGVSPGSQLAVEYADVLILAGQLDRAQAVSEVIQVPAQRQLIRARIAQERRDPVRALAEFDEALRLWPDNHWARYHAALAAEELGDFGRALQEYRYAMRIDASATDARTRTARLLAAEGQPVAALRVLRMLPDALEPEGQVLSARLSALLGDMQGLARVLALLAERHPALFGRALAEAAESVDQRAGPVAAVRMLREAPGVDFDDPRHAAALRALVRLAREADDPGAAQAALQSALAAHPEAGVFREIRALDLELSGAPVEDVRAAYAAALERAPGNALALAGAGRLALSDDPGKALALFDRAAAADPSDPDPKLQSAEVLVARGDVAAAAERLDALLVQHPFQAEAAALRARLDLERGVATARTLERALRAARFGGGVEALELLARVHEARDDPELAAQVAERARALREATASEG